MWSETLRDRRHSEMRSARVLRRTHGTRPRLTSSPPTPKSPESLCATFLFCFVHVFQEETNFAPPDGRCPNFSLCLCLCLSEKRETEKIVTGLTKTICSNWFLLKLSESVVFALRSHHHFNPKNENVEFSETRTSNHQEASKLQ